MLGGPRSRFLESGALQLFLRLVLLQDESVQAFRDRPKVLIYGFHFILARLEQLVTDGVHLGVEVLDNRADGLTKRRYSGFRSTVWVCRRFYGWRLNHISVIF